MTLGRACGVSSLIPGDWYLLTLTLFSISWGLEIEPCSKHCRLLRILTKMKQTAEASRLIPAAMYDFQCASLLAGLKPETLAIPFCTGSQAFVGQRVRGAVITVPAYFNDSQRLESPCLG